MRGRFAICQFTIFFRHWITSSCKEKFFCMKIISTPVLIQVCERWNIFFISLFSCISVRSKKGTTSTTHCLQYHGVFSFWRFLWQYVVILLHVIICTHWLHLSQRTEFFLASVFLQMLHRYFRKCSLCPLLIKILNK